MRPAVSFVAAVIVTAAAVAPVAAQPRPPVVNRPTFSPYLSLLSGYGSPALNYFALVRPQFQFMQHQAQIQQQLNQQNQAILAQNATLANGLVDPYLPATGRGAAFGYYSHYFPTVGGGSGAVVGAGTSGGGLSGGPVIPAYAANRNQTGQISQRSEARAGGAGGVRR